MSWLRTSSSSSGDVKAVEQMIAAIKAELHRQQITQAELARRLGRTEKHVSKVLNGKSGSMELDYWLWVLDHEFVVTTRPRNGKG